MSPKETAADKPLTKEAWLLEFRTEAERRRGLYNSKLVAVASLQEWVRHRDEDPVKIAQAWAKRASGSPR